MRLFVLMLVVGALVAPADARSLQIQGVTGYLGEYELSASVSGSASQAIEELSGPLTIKHVGLCSHDGPNETLSEIKLSFVGRSPLVTATLNFDGHACTFRGLLSESSNSVLSCGDDLSFPLRLWAK